MPHVLLIGKEAEVTLAIAARLRERDSTTELAAGSAEALRMLRRRHFDVVITHPDTAVEDDLALDEEVRCVRPGVRTIFLSPRTTPEEIIAALRARVFICFTPPFDPDQIATIAMQAATERDWRRDIEVVSAQPAWVSLRVNCRLLSAERLITFLNELRPDVPGEQREALISAFREILLNAMEHGAGFDPEKVVEVAAVRTARALVFYVRDPGAGFQRENLAHAALANPPEDPVAHLAERERKGLRPGGYGLLLAKNVVDELIFSEFGNEVLMVKHTA